MSHRITVNLDPELLRRLRAEADRSGAPFDDVANGAIRAGLNAVAAMPPFVVQARPMGLRPGLSYDDTGVLLDVAEGVDRRW